MINFFEKINKSVIEPNIYALVIGITEKEFLYIGVHFSLDEAYAIACRDISNRIMTENKEKIEFSLEMWNIMSARDTIIKMSDPNKINANELIQTIDNKPIIDNTKQPLQNPSIETYINNLKNIKNVLLAQLIDEGDIHKIEKMSPQIITPNEKRFVLKKISDKKNQVKRKGK